MSTFVTANNVFYEEFMLGLDKEEPDNETKRCLITNEPLEKYAITLNCGHSFNYGPLFKATDCYLLSRCHNDEKNTPTMCPYCRVITEGLLPYVPYYDAYQKIGINLPKTNSFGKNKCNAIIKSTKKPCERKCYYDKCHVHLKDDCKDNCKTLCSAITTKGVQCKHVAAMHTIYCKRHYIAL